MCDCSERWQDFSCRNGIDPVKNAEQIRKIRPEHERGYAE
jgi:hypothetical protein